MRSRVSASILMGGPREREVRARDQSERGGGDGEACAQAPAAPVDEQTQGRRDEPDRPLRPEEVRVRRGEAHAPAQGDGLGKQGEGRGGGVGG